MPKTELSPTTDEMLARRPRSNAEAFELALYVAVVHPSQERRDEYLRGAIEIEPFLSAEQIERIMARVEIRIDESYIESDG